MRTKFYILALIGASLLFSVNVYSQIVITETHTDVLCNGDNTGSIDITVTGGTPPYNYNWGGFGTTEDLTGLVAGTYCVTVTDFNSNTANQCITINEPPQMIIAGSNVTTTCFGQCMGAITLMVNGGTAPYTYYWSTGATTSTISGLCPGTYDVTVTDANGCNTTSSFTINENPQINIAATVNDATCNGLCDGYIQLSVSGGTSPYTYVWSNSTNYPINNTNLCAGGYFVAVTDANGCIANGNYTINEPAPMAVTLDTLINATNGVCNGAISVTVTGGVTPYTYLWNTSSTDYSIWNLCPGNYSLTATDNNGCVVQPNYEVGSSYDSSYTFVDTINIVIDTCIFNNLYPVDSAQIYDYVAISSDSVVLNWIFWQSGDSILLDIGVHLNTQGSNLVYLQINCSSKAVDTYQFYGMFDATTALPQNMNVMNSITVFPNPTNGKITINGNNLTQIDIVDILGKTVYHCNMNSLYSKTIDLSGEPKGIYFIKVQTSKWTEIKKIILE